MIKDSRPRSKPYKKNARKCVLNRGRKIYQALVQRRRCLYISGITKSSSSRWVKIRAIISAIKMKEKSVMSKMAGSVNVPECTARATVTIRMAIRVPSPKRQIPAKPMRQTKRELPSRLKVFQGAMILVWSRMTLSRNINLPREFTHRIRTKKMRQNINTKLRIKKPIMSRPTVDSEDMPSINEGSPVVSGGEGWKGRLICNEGI